MTEPTLITPGGSREWRNAAGKLDRVDGPARIYASGTEEWCRDGQFHREGDEPAIISAEGGRYYYKHGRRHRDGDKPAVIHPRANKQLFMEWYTEGVRTASQEPGEEKKPVKAPKKAKGDETDDDPFSHP